MTDEVMTLHELCDTFGISRRTVQGYEKHGLVRATGRNPCGYLLYDLQMQTEIQKIHQFQKFGFQVKEIGTLIVIDTCYTGKAFAGLIKRAREGFFKPEDKILFIHTGGAGGLFSQDWEHISL